MAKKRARSTAGSRKRSSRSPAKKVTRRKSTAQSKVSLKRSVKKKRPVGVSAKGAKKKKTAGAATKSVARKRTAPIKKNKPAKSTVQAVAPTEKKPRLSLASEIELLDHDILRLINKRAAATTKFIESQPNPQAALFDPRSDDILWERLSEDNGGPLSKQAVRGVFREILSSARRRVKTQRVVYLGPAFSFTHLAAIERFGEWSDLSPVSTIAAVFEEVNRGHATFGLVPIENSTDGRIVDTLEMLTRLSLRICGEVLISVHHNLLARCPRSEITEIYSKPQALSQCRDWLAKNMPQARTFEVTSTSTAAQLARDKHGVGAVASRQAAIEYDLQIIADNIENNANNVTRFAVIGDEVNKPTGKDRTAILLQIPHKPGSLSDALTTFKKNRVNLTWIESYPLRHPEVGYQFFLDFEGHVNDPTSKRALDDLAKLAVRLKVLGSYPRSDPFV